MVADSKVVGVRDRILDAAGQILEHQGLKHLNTNALAIAAGVTPPSVYRHFENKEAVVVALAYRFTEREKVWLQEAFADVDSESAYEDVLELLIDRYWSAAKQHEGIVALRGAMRVWPELRSAEEDSLSSSAALLEDLVSAQWGCASKTDARRLSRQIVEMVCSTVDRCYPLPPKEQQWRLRELKIAVKSYVSTRL